AEIHDLHEIAASPERLEDHVLRLEIAMNDAEVVRFAESGEDLAEDVDDASERERSLFVSNAREILPAQELHHEVRLAVVGPAEVEHGDRVRVIELARRACLRHEAERRVLVRKEVRVDDLDRHRAAERALLGPIDASHPADADEVEDVVPAGEGLTDELVEERDH